VEVLIQRDNTCILGRLESNFYRALSQNYQVPLQAQYAHAVANKKTPCKLIPYRYFAPPLQLAPLMLNPLRFHLNRRKTMNSDIAEGKWKQLKGELRKQWGKLTDDQIDQIAGSQEKFEGTMQEVYGKNKDEARKEWDRLTKSH